MTEVKWIKLSVNMFNDEKIKLIRTMPEGDRIIVVWVQLLCLAGKTNDNGSIYMGQNIYYTDEMLATLCDQPLNTMRIAIKTLEQFGMVENNEDGLLQIVNWEKHQSTDKMARLRYQHRERQQKYYYRNKLRELGYKESELPDDLEELKKLAKKPDVSMTLPNATEVRSKKLEERSKKKDVRSKKEEALQSNNCVTDVKRLGNTEKEIEKEIDIEIEKELETEREKKSRPPVADNAFSFYEKNGFGTLAPLIIEKMNDWINDFKDKGTSEREADRIIKQALSIAVERNKRHWNYVNGILNSWFNDGLYSTDAIEAKENQWKKDVEQKQKEREGGYGGLEF